MREREPRHDTEHAVQPRVVLRENGIDMESNLNLRGIQYETQCFERIIKEFPDKFVVGSHLIDHMFSRRGLGGESRPDALILDRTRDSWRVDMVAEYKSGHTIKGETKARGFSRLFDFLREHPLALPIMLKHSVGRYIPVPTRIVIPEDSEIPLAFVTPMKRRIEAGDIFPVQHIVHPFQYPTAA